MVAALPLIMAALLSLCTKEEQRSFFRFLWSEDVSGAAVHQRLSAQYGNGVLPQRGIYEWIEKLKNGGTNITHDKGAERPYTAITEDNKFEVMAHPPHSPDLAPSTTSLVHSNGIKGPSFHLGPRSEGSDACVARFSAEILLFGGHQEACATMDQVL